MTMTYFRMLFERSFRGLPNQGIEFGALPALRMNRLLVELQAAVPSSHSAIEQTLPCRLLPHHPAVRRVHHVDVPVTSVRQFTHG